MRKRRGMDECMLSSGMSWALLCADEEDGEWIAWQRESGQDSPCQLLIILIGVIS